MSANGVLLREKLALLVDGMTGLKHAGQFHEPNLDGRPGDYISFSSWEWPQGVGLYGLVRLWQSTGDAALRALIEGWYQARLAEPAPPFHAPQQLGNGIGHRSCAIASSSSKPASGILIPPTARRPSP